ncbi:hypothetical protein RvY_12017 [Ramazzottius varieornatus]|uniref:Uncharacterized protein n=1 Tax=Ramazzottius varieornatus TaxID=947166 RepID=A0A1D1VI46_RAMVA|nr:hypothetical protein RvY_12017 [Ramazzottius varieornatus]
MLVTHRRKFVLTVIPFCAGIFAFWTISEVYHKRKALLFEKTFREQHSKREGHYTRPEHAVANQSQRNFHKHTLDEPPVYGLPKPLYLHYIRFKPKNGDTEFKFTDFLSVMSAVQYLKPDEIVLHGDFVPSGPYWLNLTSRKLIKHISMERPIDVGMRRRKPKKIGFIEHSADIAKLDVLVEYGGITADFDVYFIRGERIKEILRRRKAVTCYGDQDGNNIGLVAGHKDSLFLWAWRRSYRDIYVDDWNFNQAFVSTYLSAVLPDEVYVVDHVCNNPFPAGNILDQFFKQYGMIQWKDSAAIHSYQRLAGVAVDTSKDLEGEATSFKEMLQYIYHNQSLPLVNPLFRDEIFAAP